MKREKESLVIQDEGEIEQEEPQIIQEIIIEELSIDGVCGVY